MTKCATYYYTRSGGGGVGSGAIITMKQNLAKMVLLVLPLTLCLSNASVCVCVPFVLYAWILSNKFSTRMNRLLPAINIFLSSVIEYHKQNTAHTNSHAHMPQPFEVRTFLYGAATVLANIFYKHENIMADWVLFNIDFGNPPSPFPPFQTKQIHQVRVGHSIALHAFSFPLSKSPPLPFSPRGK